LNEKKKRKRRRRKKEWNILSDDGVSASPTQTMILGPILFSFVVVNFIARPVKIHHTKTDPCQ